MIETITAITAHPWLAVLAMGFMILFFDYITEWIREWRKK